MVQLEREDKKAVSGKWDWDLTDIKKKKGDDRAMTVQQENIHNLIQVLQLQSSEDAYILQNSPQMLLESLVYDDCSNEDLYELYMVDSPKSPTPSLGLSTKSKLKLPQIAKIKEEIAPHSANSFNFPSPPAYSPQLEILIPQRRSSMLDPEVRNALAQKPVKNENRKRGSLIEKKIASEHQIQRKAVVELSRKAITQMDVIQEGNEARPSKPASLIEKRPKSAIPNRNASSLIDKQKNNSIFAMVERIQQEKLTIQTKKLFGNRSYQEKQPVKQPTAPHPRNQPLSHKFTPLHQSPTKENPEYSAFLRDVSKTRKSSLVQVSRKMSELSSVPPVNLIHVSNKSDLMLTIPQ
ncbi:hypothetical protein HDV01_001302 [Terramyces sp. JEL0728]|nr:hypothetical protein HDV01_001302 [Terramyces sp. JEL0728]